MLATLAAQKRQRGGVLLWVLVLLLLLILAVSVYLVRVPLLRALADLWVVDEPLEKAQAIVVLGGDSERGDRLRHAVALYRAGWAPRLVLSGSPIRTYLNEAELMEREARNLGVPAEHLVVAHNNSSSTLGEALGLGPLLGQHNFRKIIVVTSSYHTRRARQIFQGLYREKGTQVLVSAAPDANFDPERWWQQRTGRKLLFLELLKYVYTWWELFNLPSEANLDTPARRAQQSLPLSAFGCLPAGTAL